MVPSSEGYLEEYMSKYMEYIAWLIALILNILFKKVRVGGEEASSTFPGSSLRMVNSYPQPAEKMMSNLREEKCLIPICFCLAFSGSF